MKIMETLKTNVDVDKQLSDKIGRLTLNEKRKLASELDNLMLYKEAEVLNKGVRKNNITMDEIVEIVRKVRRKNYLKNARQNRN